MGLASPLATWRLRQLGQIRVPQHSTTILILGHLGLVQLRGLLQLRLHVDLIVSGRDRQSRRAAGC